MKGLYIGRVSDIKPEKGMVRVAYPAPNETLSEWLPLLMFEYNMPAIGALVATILDDNENGVCLGMIYSNEQTPAVKTGYYKKIGNAVITAAGDNFKIQLGSGYIEFLNGTIHIHGVETVIDNYDGRCTNSHD